MKRKTSVEICLLMMVVACSFSLLAHEKPLVAVMPVEEGDLSWKWFRDREILNGITQMITDRLVQESDIRVVERTRIEEILKEQDFGSSGRVDPVTAARIGKVLGVDALILSTLTTLNVAEVGGISVGPLTVKGVKAEVIITGRVVDATTAEIKDSFEARGEEIEASIKVSDLQGLSFGTTAFNKSVVGKCIREAVENFARNIISNPDRLMTHQIELRGKVVKIVGSKLIVDIGSRSGVRERMTGKLIRMVEVEELQQYVSVPIGEVQVYSVNPDTCILEVLWAEEAPMEGDYVDLISLK